MLLLIARLVLAAVLAVAAIAKLRDLDGSRRAASGFGVPGRLAAVVGTLLPFGELAIAGALVAEPSAAWGALAAMALLIAFAVAIAHNLARGRSPDCNCFGQLHSSPAGGWAVARNVALAVFAGIAAVGLGKAEPAFALAAAGALAIAPAIPRAFSRRRGGGGEGLPIGEIAPGFGLPALGGATVTLDSLRERGRPALLVFSDPGCGPCIALAPEVARWQREHSDELVIAVIEGESEGSAPSTDEHGRTNVLLQRDREVADLYRARGTPTAVLVGADGAIASPVAAGSRKIEALMAGAVDGFEERSPSPSPARPALGSPFRRRELVVRGAGAWAAASTVLAWPLRAVAAASGRQPRGGGEGARCQGDPNEENYKPCATFFRCCSGRCRSDTSRRNCGRCGKRCADDEVCRAAAGGARCEKCPAGTRRCGGGCGDPGTQRCCGGTLYDTADLGPGDWRCCGRGGRRRLVDVGGDDPKHCGACGNRCAEGEVCYEGKCRKRCPRGLRKCKRRGARRGVCYDPDREVCCDGKVVAGTDSCACVYGPGATDAFEAGAFCASGCFCGGEEGCCS